MNYETLQILKKKLPYNWSGKIAKKTGYSKSLVIRVINGEINNATVIDEAIQLAKEHQKEIKEKEALINSL